MSEWHDSQHNQPIYLHTWRTRNPDNFTPKAFEKEATATLLLQSEFTCSESQELTHFKKDQYAMRRKGQVPPPPSCDHAIPSCDNVINTHVIRLWARPPSLADPPGWLGAPGVLHDDDNNNDDDMYMTPQGRPVFAALKGNVLPSIFATMLQDSLCPCLPVQILFETSFNTCFEKALLHNFWHWPSSPLDCGDKNVTGETRRMKI